MRRRIILLALIIFLTGSIKSTSAQRPAPSPQDVIRIKTELVQTDVMVFDKQGHFVDGVKPEDFELSVDGHPQSILFFERVTAGTPREAAQLKARNTKSKTVQDELPIAPPASVQDRARTIFFFVDDLHLNGAGIARARKALNEFVDQQMRPNDQVAIVSTSGLIGFLQQLTDNKTVLRTAILRLNDKRNNEGYAGRTRITDYMASRIANLNDRALFAYLLESTKLEQQMGPGSRHGDHRLSSSLSAVPYLQNRLRQIQAQSRFDTINTLSTLRSLLASSASLPGRKIVFFLSDGFIVNQQDTNVVDMLKTVTESAAQTGAVIYTMDLRDTSVTPIVDVSASDYVDFSARATGLAAGEIASNREPLQTIADETGGRTLINPDSITDEISGALDETAQYYLLAWRPETDQSNKAKLKLGVKLKNHPEWRVRLRHKFYAAEPDVAQTKVDARLTRQLTSVAELQQALGSLYPRREAPVQLSVGYVAARNANAALKLSMQVDPRSLAIESGENGKAELDVMGAAIDDRGVIVTFKHLLTLTPEIIAKAEPVIWHQELQVPAGLYQVRVAVRDRQLGLSGSAMQWIVVPELARKEMVLSSLFVAGRKSETVEKSEAPSPLAVSVDHHFASGSILRFQTYVYNADPTPGGELPSVEIQARVIRNGREVLTGRTVPVPAGANRLVGLPYWAEIPLEKLPAGRYELRVSALDCQTKSTATEETHFIID